MNEQFEDWFDQAISGNLFELTAPSAQHKAALAAWTECERRKSMKPEKIQEHFACHFNNYPEDCLLDRYDHDTCIEAASWKDRNRTKFECKYWTSYR